MFKKYNISETDSFNLSDYPKVENEMKNMLIRIANTPQDHKSEIIISFLKKHSIRKEWASVNPKLAMLISGSYFTTSHMEYLFESCHNNSLFMQDYEECIKSAIAALY